MLVIDHSAVICCVGESSLSLSIVVVNNDIPGHGILFDNQSCKVSVSDSSPERR